MLKLNLNLLLASAISIMLLVSVVVLYLVFGTKPSQQASLDVKPKLMIDHDGGADDAMAIFMALLYEKYHNGPEVVAISTTHGNVGEEQTFNNTQRILSIADRRNVPIYRGSSKALVSGMVSDHYFGLDGLGDKASGTYAAITSEKEHAVFGLIELSKKYEGELVIVALGSLTNIALAIRLDPDFVSRLSQLYVAAGHVYSENYTKAEFNAAMDVESYHIVVNSGIPDKLTVIPFSQILTYQNISGEWRSDVLGTINTKIMQAQNSFEQISFDNRSYWCLLDPSAMAIALDESSILEDTVYSTNSITMCGDERGINTNEFTKEDAANVRLIYKVKLEPYKEFLYKVFSSDLEAIDK